jgi:asparagine N-glycosylation enzyme membrane subunit Stt3
MNVVACSDCAVSGFRGWPFVFIAAALVAAAVCLGLLRRARGRGRWTLISSIAATVLIVVTTAGIGFGTWRALVVHVDGGTIVCGTTLGATQESYAAPDPAIAFHQRCRDVAEGRLRTTRQLGAAGVVLSIVVAAAALATGRRESEQSRAAAS